MKEVKHYICETCGTEYAEKDLAQRCEKNHKSIKEIVGVRYLSYSQDQTGFPQTITIRMNDGREATYKR